jgi:hypothetical protein
VDRYAPLDSALDALAAFGPDLQNGLTNHAPMAAEALCALSRPASVPAWIERYHSGLAPRPPAIGRIRRADWASALGRVERTSDWENFFAVELDEAPWRDVVRRWTGTLAPAHCASAAHGVIRTGHAVRALLDRESPARLRELACGLGYWAANFQKLPRAAGGDGPRLSATLAIEAVPIVPPEDRRFTGTIVSSLEALDGFAAFAPVIDRLDVSRALDEVLSDLTETFAHVYLANARDVLGSIVFLHAVTGAAAVRTLLPLLDPTDARDLVRFAWQTGAGLYAAFGSRPTAPFDTESPLLSEPVLVDRAIANGDEHAIKFAEACLREHALRPSAAFLAAASHAIDLLPPAAG